MGHWLNGRILPNGARRHRGGGPARAPAGAKQDVRRFEARPPLFHLFLTTNPNRNLAVPRTSFHAGFCSLWGNVGGYQSAICRVVRSNSFGRPGLQRIFRPRRNLPSAFASPWVRGFGIEQNYSQQNARAPLYHDRQQKAPDQHDAGLSAFRRQKYRWLLDAKSPGENIVSGKHVEQAYSYAIHPEIRAQYFALCNGGRFTLFDIHDQVPLMNIELSQLELKWPTLVDFLSPDSFRRVVDAPKKSAGATAARLSKYQAAGGNNGFS